MAVVAEHVEARARRREQHGVTGTRGVQSLDPKLREGHQGGARAREPRFALLDRERVVGAAGPSERKGERAGRAARHGDGERIVEIDHRRLAALVNARLGGGVTRELPVAVEMIGTDVEHRGGAAGEALRRLGPEARELEHVELGAAAEESERGLPEVAPGAHPHSRALRHTGEQRRDGALAVGTGDAGDRSIDRARKELDVADDAEPAAARLDEERALAREPGRDDDARRARKERGVERTCAHRDVGPQRAQRRELRGSCARVGDREPPALREQVTRAREPRDAQAHDHGVRCADGGRAHLSFSVASPASTSSSEMIQKRTMTLGSAQPLSAKWWWIGAILKIRLPVSLKEATWRITEAVSRTNTPLITSTTSSWRTITASTPIAAPIASAPTSPMNTWAG